MADIPVEKKGGSSIWPWLLGLLALLALIILFFQIFIDEEDEADNEAMTEQVEPRETEPQDATADAAAAGGVITSAAMLMDAENPAQLAGRQVQLSDLRVTSLLGDSAFYATPDTDDRRFLVALDEETPTPQDQTEGRYDVTEGQILDIDGGVREITNEADTWGLSAEEAEQMQNDAIYIRAQSLNIVEEATQ